MSPTLDFLLSKLRLLHACVRGSLAYELWDWGQTRTAAGSLLYLQQKAQWGINRAASSDTVTTSYPRAAGKPSWPELIIEACRNSFTVELEFTGLLPLLNERRGKTCGLIIFCFIKRRQTERACGAECWHWALGLEASKMNSAVSGVRQEVNRSETLKMPLGVVGKCPKIICPGCREEVFLLILCIPLERNFEMYWLMKRYEWSGTQYSYVSSL